MPATCFFCETELPQPADDGTVPGGRAAFDPWLGRLWLVCPGCTRWNPVPLDARWEALESLERLARDHARLVLRTDHLSLLALPKAQLIRVGQAPRLELADWRYSSRLDAHPVRRRGWWARLLSLLPERGVMGDFQPYATVYQPSLEWAGAAFIEHGAILSSVFAVVPVAETCPGCHGPLMLEARRFGDLRILRERDGVHLATTCAVCGEEAGVPLREARPALRVGLAVVDRHRREPELVATAASRIERRGGHEPLLHALAARAPALGGLPVSARLALAMALDEQSETEALEAEWRSAEELASIADGDLTDVPGYAEFRARSLPQIHRPSGPVCAPRRLSCNPLGLPVVQQ